MIPNLNLRSAITYRMIATLRWHIRVIGLEGRNGWELGRKNMPYKTAHQKVLEAIAHFEKRIHRVEDEMDRLRGLGHLSPLREEGLKNQIEGLRVEMQVLEREAKEYGEGRGPVGASMDVGAGRGSRGWNGLGTARKNGPGAER